MIRNIIFDVGKVLVSYEPDAYMQRLGISKEKQKKINEAMFQNKLWDTSDQGLGTPDEFLQKFIAGAPELADEITKIHKTVGNTVELFPYAMEWILDLKARGYHVYILSNYSENMLDQTKDKLKFLPLMDGVVFSYKIKKMKPDPEIYEYLCDEYWLEPEESVFIDDRPVNIKGLRPTLYAVVSIFVSTKISDAFLEGFKTSKAAFIITNRYEEVAERLMDELDRGVTGLHAQGMYTEEKKCVLYCVVSRKEIVRVKEIVNDVDSSAFVIVSDVREVLGEGFLEYSDDF